MHASALMTWLLPGWCITNADLILPTAPVACRANLCGCTLMKKQVALRFTTAMPKLVSVVKVGLRLDGRVVPLAVKVHHVSNQDSGEQVCNALETYQKQLQ